MTDISRFVQYQNDVCWQKRIKDQTLIDDMVTYGMDFISEVSIDTLEFQYVDKSDTAECKRITKFIERYEWLGKMPVWVTHRFTATYNGVIIAAIVMATPYAFSKFIDGYSNREKLIARGASISFAPDNIASWIIMKSIKWMVANTEFRIFSAYSDPVAGEVGTVYQACNFFYLGQTFGGNEVYITPDGKKQVSGTYFNNRSVIKKSAIKHGVDWKPEYLKSNKNKTKRIVAWENIPDDVQAHIRKAVEIEKEKYTKVTTSKKHKYVYVLGRGKLETKSLRRLFQENNETLEYPKERGELAY